MDVRATNLRMINEVDGTWDVVAAFLGMSKASLHNRVYEVKGQKLSVEDTMVLQSLSKTTHFADVVADATGGVFVKMPDAASIAQDSIHAKFNELYADVGALFSEYQADIKNDGVIDDAEFERLQTILADMHKKGEELLSLMMVIGKRRVPALKVA